MDLDSTLQQIFNNSDNNSGAYDKILEFLRENIMTANGIAKNISKIVFI